MKISFQQKVSRFLTKPQFWVFMDGVIIASLYVLFVVSSEFLALPFDWVKFWVIVAVHLPLQIGLMIYFGIYRMMVRFISIEDMLRIIYAVLPVNLLIGISFRFSLFLPFRLLFFILMVILQLFFIVSVRLLVRVYTVYKVNLLSQQGRQNKTLLIGAGNGAELVIKEQKRSMLSQIKMVGILDDNPQLTRQTLLGVPILGTTDILLETIDTYAIDEVIIAIANVSLKKVTHWLEVLTQRNVTIKRLPLISEIDLSKPVQLQPVQVKDLLSRESVDLDNPDLAAMLENKTVLVTGAGGSIGSELCRQIAYYKPQKLILFDVYENSTYDLQLDLIREYPELTLEVIIGSVYNPERIQALFKEHSPQIVYHAAAYKHVPLMEHNAVEALRTNVMGTYYVAQAAHETGTQRFVLISSDKAVRPTNVMGATKRLAELIVQFLQKDSQTVYSAVRFGNVLNSNGSVIPIFQRQIERGGPVTVTHPDITRYFMTIPEAISLILQASVYARHAELFVLDMGEPVKIAQLAERMIRLNGLKPYEDIEITFTGLRPGEKLFEELLIDGDTIHQTENQKIFVEKSKSQELTDLHFLEELKALNSLTLNRITAFLQQYVIDYQPSSHAKNE